MKNSDNNIDIEIRSLLQARRINHAIAQLENAAHQLSSVAALDRIRAIAQSYEYLSRYALDGIDDPSRDRLLADITASLYGEAIWLKREMLVQQAPTLYFNVLRTNRLRPEPDRLSRLVEQYRAISGQIAAAMLAGEAPGGLHAEAEAIEKTIFEYFWTAYPLAKSDGRLIASMASDETLPSHFRQQLVGAVFIGLDSWFDEQRITLLADIYDTVKDDNISLKALTALVMSLWIHRDALFSSRLTDRMSALIDSNPGVGADIREVVMQIIRTRDTDRITRKITEEVIPEMMKLRPDIEKSMKNQSPEALLDPEANPEWDEMLEKSGVAERLRELQELQEEGADVMMSTFGRLKTFPFFNDIVNWFTPFHADHTVVSGSSGSAAMLGTMMENSPMFCDNDKYSFILSITQIPEAQRRMLEEQIGASVSQFQMMQAASTVTSADRRVNIIRNFTRDLYRFFKLFRRKGEFNDPFLRPLNPSRIPLAGNVLDSEDLLSLIGQFYFSNRYWQEAVEIMTRYADLYGTTAEILQKTGYSLQQQGLHAEALEQFRRSEMLGDSSRWLLRRMAVSLKALGRYDEELDCLRRLEASEPDDLRLALSIGRTLMKTGRYDEALKYLYKVEYSTPGKTGRLMAWSTFMIGDYDKSASLWEAILRDSPSATDFMNAGHLALVRGDFREAARLYSASIAARDFSLDAFILDFAADREVLAAKGVTPFMEGIVIDEASRLSSSLGSKL